jgi:3-methyl-2-oxobutanoate hydroxymethyltransferase
VFGKDFSVACELIESAQALESAGAVFLLIEKVPEELCRIITSQLSIPVIGIGSGRYCDAQVLVVHDIIGLAWRSFRHARAYADIRSSTTEAIKLFVAEVVNGSFPDEEHVSHLNETVLQEINTHLGK